MVEKLADNDRKDLDVFFNELGLSMAADFNSHTDNFLNITRNLEEGKVAPYEKPDDEPLYINRRGSNHRPSVKRTPKVVNVFPPHRQMTRISMQLKQSTRMP